MKHLRFVLALGAVLLVVGSYAPRAAAAPAFEDPQLCVAGKLLRIDPTTAPIDVWVRVGPNVDIDFTVANCGGDSSQPTVDRSQVSTDGKKNKLEVTVQTDPKAKVVFNYGAKTKLMKADKSGLVIIKTKAK